MRAWPGARPQPARQSPQTLHHPQRPPPVRLLRTLLAPPPDQPRPVRRRLQAYAPAQRATSPESKNKSLLSKMLQLRSTLQLDNAAPQQPEPHRSIAAAVQHAAAPWPATNTCATDGCLTERGQQTHMLAGRNVSREMLPSALYGSAAYACAAAASSKAKGPCTCMCCEAACP